MTTHAITLFDNHHTICNNRTYVRTTYASTSNQPFYSYLTTTLPIPSINICENLLYERKISEDIDSTISSASSYINSNEHYDNTYIHTYDNPIQYLENYHIKQNLIDLSHNNETLYDNTTIEKIHHNHENYYSSNISHHNTSPILFYLENKRLVSYACIISILLLLTIGIGMFLLNKFIRPVIINTTVNNHYDITNLSNISTTSIISRSTISSTVVTILIQSSTTIPVTTSTIAIDNLVYPYSPCPSDRWGIECKNICKPCGLGVCHSITGNCICPDNIYGEFCDLWKVDDTPKRGDMMS